jgi:acyl-CoA reductase-like NAD-dependent aldehyde dehydrogenase
MRVVDPATGTTIEELDETPPEAVAGIVASARDARRATGWGEAGAAEWRAEVVRRFGSLVAERREELARLLTRETGKPITQARNELDGVVPRVEFFLDATPRVLAADTVLDDPGAGLRERITYEPLGTVANVSAWNYPWFVGVNVFVPALLTGNAVIYKPSEYATLTGLAIGRLWAEAGLPEGLFRTVVGAGPVGEALVRAPVDAVCFTGSVATGRRIAEAVAGRTVRLQLELGGKDPVYVADDVDVAAAAAALADGAFYNNGQSCCSVERLYVHERVHDAFVEAFVETVRGFRLGDPMDEGTYLGPLTRPAQVDLLAAQVADALARGATLRCGGHRLADRPGTWFEPTVLTEVDHTMAVMRDESFGPIIGIQRVEGDEEAVRWMADTDYGLTAGVYSADEDRARAVLERLDVGSAYWNCCDRVSPRLPWSGRRNSGIGVTLSTLGIATFVQPKAWHLRAPHPSTTTETTS